MKVKSKRCFFKHKRIYFLFLFFIFPYITILIIHPHEWIGRIIVLSVVLLLGTMFIFLYALNPKIKFIKEKGKLARPQFAKIRYKVEFISRLFFILLAGLLLWYAVIPFTIDIINIIKGDKINIIQGEVLDNMSPFGLWFLNQTLTIKEQSGATKSCNYIYSFETRLLKGKKYKFKLLSRSKLVLEAKVMPP